MDEGARVGGVEEGATMAIFKRFDESVQQLLEPHEEVIEVLPCQTNHPYVWWISSWAHLASNRHRIIVVTDRRILLVSRMGSRITEVIGTVDRGEPLGMRRRGVFIYRCDAFGETVYLSRGHCRRLVQVAT